ncbi:MAG: sigma-70 family RNA polymerase sigma factor [Polyangiaceae bacterium]
MTATAAASLTEAFRQSERHLWGLCYRMTGCAADADDLVQETFARAVERPPRDGARPLRPWLVKVAVNLSRDLLRRRRRRGYVGPYLAAPVEPTAYESESTAGRYDLLESVSLAFLLALEELTPQKRAVLLLRDVFDYTVQETAEALDMSEANVKTTLHRARRQMADYEAEQRLAVGDPRHGAALQAMFGCLAARDHDGFAALVAADLRALSDGAGVFHAALRPIVGVEKVWRFFTSLMDKRGMPDRIEARVFNGAPALVIEWLDPPAGFAGCNVTWLDLDEEGRVTTIYSQLAPRKLHRL